MQTLPNAHITDEHSSMKIIFREKRARASVNINNIYIIQPRGLFYLAPPPTGGYPAIVKIYTTAILYFYIYIYKLHIWFYTQYKGHEYMILLQML